MKVNFFWTGNQFQFLHRIGIQSHIRVGHDPVVWLHGPPPSSPYWVGDIVPVRNADNIYDITPLIDKRTSVRALSTIWSWHLLYKRGGLYCDVDHIALQSFPEDDWILVRAGEGNRINVGMIKAPSSHQLFKEAIDRAKLDWGNIAVFNYLCKKHGLDETHDTKLFYPWGWKNWPTVLTNRSVPNAKSFHLFGRFIDQLKLDEKQIKNLFPHSLLGEIVWRIQQHRLAEVPKGE